ncbi:hypothetical protein LNP25_24040 [Klebsiella variicola subsp. variicola]|nr:hypothetical protein [Klebsiella variicola subsp. variicola]
MLGIPPIERAEWILNKRFSLSYDDLTGECVKMIKELQTNADSLDGIDLRSNRQKYRQCWYSGVDWQPQEAHANSVLLWTANILFS